MDPTAAPTTAAEAAATTSNMNRTHMDVASGSADYDTVSKDNNNNNIICF
jgi:hypothetical protein